MRIFRATYLMLGAALVLINMPGEQQQADAVHLHLLLLLPSLLLKIGLAAPIVIAVLAKLLLLLGLGTKAVGISTILGGANDSHEKTSYGAPSSRDNLGRIKRSTTFVRQIVGEDDLSEEEIFETLFKLDSLRCGEKLLCEVASSVASRKVKDVSLDDDEIAMITLFSKRRANEGPAQKAYKNAILNGLRSPQCSSKYPACPYGKTMMMQLVHLVTGAVQENIQHPPIFADHENDLYLKNQKLTKI